MTHVEPSLDAGEEGDGAAGGCEADAVRGDYAYGTYVLRVNIAFALQELRQTARSVHILSALYDAVEAVEDAVALRVCTLLTRVGQR